jgi:hypothetical protein
MAEIILIIVKQIQLKLLIKYAVLLMNATMIVVMDQDMLLFKDFLSQNISIGLIRLNQIYHTILEQLTLILVI